MGYARCGAVRLYYEATGAGVPVVFVHEFGGDSRSWQPQVGFFARRYRCVTYNARGYPPSDVPDDPEAYSQAIAVEDLAAVLRQLDVSRAHIVGLSMGSGTALHFALKYPGTAASLVLCGCGYGSVPGERKAYEAQIEEIARRFESLEMRAAAEAYGAGPYREPFRAKDPRGWAAFVDMLAEHPARAAALTLRGIQKRRPALPTIEGELRALRVPTLIVVGDRDEPALEPSLYLKRVVPGARLWVLPNTGHTVNLEEPDLFNSSIDDFITLVELGRWA